MKKIALTSNWQKVGKYTIHTRIAKHDTDHSKTIVLIHGLSVSSRYMVPTAKRLAKYYSVYALDFPGYGKSDKPSHTLTIQEMADVLAEWMKVMKLEKAIFLGNSLGCQIIADFTFHYPQYVSHTILTGPSMDDQARSFPQEIFRLLRDAFHEPLSYLPVALKEYTISGIKRTIEITSDSLHDPIEKKLPYIQIPTLVVRGEKDTIVSQEWVEKITKLLPHASLVIIPKAGHAVNFNSPDILVKEVRRFLEE